MKKALIIILSLSLLFSLIVTAATASGAACETLAYTFFMVADTQFVQLSVAYIPWALFLYSYRKRGRQPSLLLSVIALLLLFNGAILIMALPGYSRQGLSIAAFPAFLLYEFGAGFIGATIYAFALPLAHFLTKPFSHLTMKHVILALLLCSSMSAVAQAPVNSNDFLKDCIQTAGDVGNRKMGLWLPPNLWEMVGAQMKADTEVMNIIVDEMKRYMMFAVVDCRIDGQDFTFLPDESIRPSIHFYDSAGNAYAPVDERKLSEMSTQLLLAIKPKLAQFMGQMGEGMHIYMFDAKKINAKSVIDVTKPNRFSLRWNDAQLEWKLPLASMLAPKHCPADRAEMQGNWNYCPFHGVKLVP